MTESVIVALGTLHPETIQLIKEITFRYQAQTQSRFRIDFTTGWTAREPVEGVPTLVKEACTRAHLLRSETKAPVGIATAVGDVDLVYNKGARRAKFMACVIAGVTKSGLTFAKVPSACPDDALTEFGAQLQVHVTRHATSNPHVPIESFAAEVVTLAWGNLEHSFPKPIVDLLG